MIGLLTITPLRLLGVEQNRIIKVISAKIWGFAPDFGSYNLRSGPVRLETSPPPSGLPVVGVRGTLPSHNRGVVWHGRGTGELHPHGAGTLCPQSPHG